MKAIHVEPAETGTRLTWKGSPDPALEPGSVIVDTHATALNRADLMQRAGNYPPPPGASQILGLETAGVIAETGPEVVGWAVGDKVCALLPGGGYAEKASVPAAMLMPVPGHWSFDEAAAIPEIFLTAFVNLFMEAGLESGETVFIHGGASGVGTAAIQLARHSGCRVFATAGTLDKVARCRELGADLAVNYHEEDFALAVEDHAGRDAVHVVLDMVGAPYLERNFRVMAPRGRLVLISMLGGARAEIDLRTVLMKRLKLIGSTLRSRNLEEKIDIRNRFMDRFWPRLVDGTIRPVIDSVYPIHEADAAHDKMALNRNIGKIILRVRGLTAG